MSRIDDLPPLREVLANHQPARTVGHEPTKISM